MPADVKSAIRQRIEASSDVLIELSHRIHANPEIAFEEVKASGWLAGELDEAGFQVETTARGLPTAFEAKAGSGPTQVVICAEYDALPGIGHACGHNIIGATAVGAAIGLRARLDDLGLTLRVVGTPAEEIGDGGGKILMLERGAFEGAHAAMMVHPGPRDVLAGTMIAVATFEVTYTGRESHAAAYPELGINALDALTVAQVGIGLLRQHIRPTDRIHGVVTHGGSAPNVVPALATARFMVRARSLEELDEIRERVWHCFEAGALATGAQLALAGGTKPYAEVHHNKRMARLFDQNWRALGRSFPPPRDRRPAASTDMGNVSRVVPTIHPLLGIGAPPGVVNHQPGFAAQCASPVADRTLLDGAVAMAWTAVDLGLAGTAP
jgi:amidohydrolase